MADQLPIEPLTKTQRAKLSQALVELLLMKESVEKGKANDAAVYNEQLKDLKKSIHELTKRLDEPEELSDELKATVRKMGDDYMNDHQARAGIVATEGFDPAINPDEETIEVTADDLPDDDGEITF